MSLSLVDYGPVSPSPLTRGFDVDGTGVREGSTSSLRRRVLGV